MIVVTYKMISISLIEKIVVIIVFIITIVLFFKSIKIIRPFEKGVVERFGKYRKIINQGLNFIIPFIETCRVVDMREIVIGLDNQEALTKDNLKLLVDIVIHFKVIDPYKILYNVARVETSMRKLIDSFMEEIIGEILGDNLSVMRIEIKNQLFSKLEKSVYKWGIKLISVSINRLELIK